MARNSRTAPMRGSDNAAMSAARPRGRAGGPAASKRVKGGAEFAVQAIDLDAIRQSSQNPRLNMGSIDELAASLAAYGMLQPVLVRALEGEYELIAGHRRVAAARRLGWRTISAIVRSRDDDAYV